jgi:hypothetical protein
MSNVTRAARLEAADRFDLARRHGADDLAALSLRLGESDAGFRTRLMGRLLERQLGASFSFARMVDCMANGKLTGAERELLQESARHAQETFDETRVRLPWSLFARDLSTASGSAGAFLVATETGEAFDVLRPWSVAARAGVSIVERLRGNQTLPRTTAKTTGYWLADETTAITSSTPSLGQISLTPKTGGGLVTFSRQLANQAAVESYVRRELLRTVGTLVDQAILNGSGASGQPTGILATAGVQSQSGTTLGLAGVTNMKEQCASNNAPDEAIAFVGTPQVRELLETRERATGSGFVWDADTVASRRALVSSDVPAATLICGAWSDAILALWGDGFVFELNPFDPTGFKTGTIQARLVVSCDVAIAHPSAWCVASSIT